MEKLLHIWLTFIFSDHFKDKCNELKRFSPLNLNRIHTSVNSKINFFSFSLAEVSFQGEKMSQEFILNRFFP